MDWHDGIRAFARFMHSWFVTVVFAIVFIASLVGWLTVGFRFGYDKVVRDNTPMPPPTAVVPVPEGWKLVQDDACAGNHCSTRLLVMSPDAPTTGGQALAAFTKTFETAGFNPRIVNGMLVAGRDPVALDVNWPADAELVHDAKLNVGFTSSAAGRSYWQDAIFFIPVEDFRQRLTRLTLFTIGLMVVLWLTEGLAQDPVRPRAPRESRLPRV